MELKREEDGKPCMTSVTIIFFEITFRQSSLSFKQILLQRTRKHWCLMKITTKHASNSPVTFITRERFDVLFFLPYCSVNSLVLKSVRPNDTALTLACRSRIHLKYEKREGCQQIYVQKNYWIGFCGWHNPWTNRGTINAVSYLSVCLFIDRLVVWMPIRQLSTKSLLAASLGSNPHPLERQLLPHPCQNQSSTSTEFWVMLR